MVIMDSPPMMQSPDARVLGRAADGLILVVRSGKTTEEEALSALTCLQDDEVPILGTVLNDWNPKGSSSYRHYRSYYA
jgi:Mrp family chromosome partitioning ATPase